MDEKILEVFRFLGIEEYLLDEKYNRFRLENDMFEAYSQNRLDKERKEIAEVTALDITRISNLLLSCSGMRRANDIYTLIYSKPFLIQIPTELDHILLIKVGPAFVPDPIISRLWEQRVPYIITDKYTKYKENGKLTEEPHTGQKHVKNIRNAFYGMAFDMNSYESLHNSGDMEIASHTETLTLINDDMIIIRFGLNGQIVEFSHLMNGPSWDSKYY